MSHPLPALCIACCVNRGLAAAAVMQQQDSSSPPEPHDDSLTHISLDSLTIRQQQTASQQRGSMLVQLWLQQQLPLLPP
jgi:hypothetical protein